MIEKMKKITLVCLASDKETALEELRDLGVMHVVQAKQAQSEDLADVRQKKDKLQEIINILKPHRDSEERSFPEFDDKTTIELLKEAWQAVHDIQWYEENISNHDRMTEALKPWGEFDGKLVEQLRDKGLDVRFCCCRESDMPKLPENATAQEVNRIGDEVYFLVLSTTPLELSLPEVEHLHLETSLSELEERNNVSKKTVALLKGKLQIFANYMARYEEVMQTLEEKEEFLANRDGMGEDKVLAYIGGYIPASAEEKVKEAGRQHGWALQSEDVDPEDPEVPTKLTVPKFARMTGPMFRFLGITPGYNETDVSVTFLLFLSLFFAMLIGDAGYGLIFAACGFIAKSKIKDKKKHLPVNLFLVFSITTVVWGLLTGVVFGIPQEHLPALLKGLDWFTGGDSEANIKMLCFLIAAIHLSLARVWKGLLLLRYPLKALGNWGWAVFVWGNFYMACHLLNGTAFPKFALYMYIVGAVLILLFDINWKDVGDVINAPFGFINSFVDVLSYIRLFAVGFASLKIAQSFNGMGAEMFSEGGVSVFFAVLVIGLGHLLNIILGFMAVLVHGVRLNTLEFSNHMGITWGGLFFKPFKKINKS